MMYIGGVHFISMFRNVGLDISGPITAISVYGCSTIFPSASTATCAVPADAARVSGMPERFSSSVKNGLMQSKRRMIESSWQMTLSTVVHTKSVQFAKSSWCRSGTYKKLIVLHGTQSAASDRNVGSRSQRIFSLTHGRGRPSTRGIAEKNNALEMFPLIVSSKKTCSQPGWIESAIAVASTTQRWDGRANLVPTGEGSEGRSRWPREIKPKFEAGGP